LARLTPIAWALWLALALTLGAACDDLTPRPVDPPKPSPLPRVTAAAPSGTGKHLALRVERDKAAACERPFGLALDAETQTLFVACAGSGLVVALDAQTLAPRWTCRRLYERIYKLVLDPPRRRLYAVGMNGRSLYAINARTGIVVDQLPVEGAITDMALVPGGDRLVLATTQPPHAALVDLNAFRIDAAVTFPTPPGSLAVRSDGELAVANSGLWQIKGRDAEPLQAPVYLFDPRQGGRPFGALGLGGAQARQALFVRNGAELLVTERTADSVAIFDVASRKLIRTVPSGAAPEKLAASPDGKWAFVLDSKGASIARIDIAARETDNYVALTANPQDIAVSPDNRELYVALPGAEDKPGSVAVIDAAAMNLLDMIPVGRDPCQLLLAPAGDKLYVSNFLSDSVSLVE
jgi:YVTN family beta-propeller protein